jgi:hypothetical protein
LGIRTAWLRPLMNSFALMLMAVIPPGAVAPASFVVMRFLVERPDRW